MSRYVVLGFAGLLLAAPAICLAGAERKAAPAKKEAMTVS